MTDLKEHYDCILFVWPGRINGNGEDAVFTSISVANKFTNFLSSKLGYTVVTCRSDIPDEYAGCIGIGDGVYAEWGYVIEFAELFDLKVFRPERDDEGEL